jgi:hypothetical protein
VNRDVILGEMLAKPRYQFDQNKDAAIHLDELRAVLAEPQGYAGLRRRWSRHSRQH